MLSKYFLTALILFLFVSCSNTADTSTSEEETEDYNPREAPLPSTGENVTDMAKNAQLNLLISESKKTLDSINVAYKFIMNERKTGGLSLYEKEQVNQALMELNDAKDLIILETQQAVISELKERTASLQTVMANMNTASDKMQQIAITLSKVSNILEKTTNILSTALTSGIIRPKMPATDRNS